MWPKTWGLPEEMVGATAIEGGGEEVVGNVRVRAVGPGTFRRVPFEGQRHEINQRGKADLGDDASHNRKAQGQCELVHIAVAQLPVFYIR